jgi:hypothetical protein
MSQSLKAREAAKQEAIAELRRILPDGGTVFTILRHRSRTGLRRVITPVVFVDGSPLWPTYLVAQACGYSIDKVHEGVAMGGCGYDAANAIVEHLRHELGYASLKQVRL